MNGTKITIAERHALFAEALDIALTIRGCKVKQLTNEDQTWTGTMVSNIIASKPDVVLLGVHGSSRVHMIQPLAEAGLYVVALTAEEDFVLWGECLLFGARVVLAKTTTLPTVMSTVRRVASGQRVLPVQERERLIGHFRVIQERHQMYRDRLSTLTQRERQVLGRLMHGDHVAIIALDSTVSESTVRSQVKSILSKLQVKSQLAAVGIAIQTQWQPPNQLVS